MRTVCKWFALMVLMLSLLCSFFSVNSAEKRSIWLSGAAANKNRLFTTELRVSGFDDIGAFTAVVEYDTEKLIFRGINTEDKEAECSAHSVEEGKVNIVYFSKDGKTASSETPLLSLEFRALSYGTSKIELEITDVVDSNGEDIKDFVSEGCTVRINGGTVVNSEDKSRKKPSRPRETRNTIVENFEETADESKGNLQINGSFVTEKTVVFTVFAGLLIVVVTALVAYKAGMKKQQMRNLTTLETISEDNKERKNKDAKARK